jgi:hypothetical protein
MQSSSSDRETNIRLVLHGFAVFAQFCGLFPLIHLAAMREKMQMSTKKKKNSRCLQTSDIREREIVGLIDRWLFLESRRRTLSPILMT